MPARVLAGLRRHAAAAGTAECCGALIGRCAADCIEVRAMIPVENLETDAGRYAIDAPTVLRLERQAGAVDMQLVGFYHSHPQGEAVPSTTDLELGWPSYVYAIIQTVGGSVRCWRLRHDRSGFAELPLAVPPDGP
jgi:proteasome lid subunit RPN8/RPN11